MDRELRYRGERAPTPPAPSSEDGYETSTAQDSSKVAPEHTALFYSPDVHLYSAIETPRCIGRRRLVAQDASCRQFRPMRVLALLKRIQFDTNVLPVTLKKVVRMLTRCCSAQGDASSRMLRYSVRSCNEQC